MRAPEDPAGPLGEDGARLSARLRTATSQVHREAEGHPLIGALLREELSGSEYGLLLGDLLPVYVALEESLEANRGTPWVTSFVLPELWRADALRADLAVLHPTPPPPSAAALSYADRIRAVAASDPTRLVAHSYVRYLGDLAGGRILARHAAAIAGPAAVSFYRFPAIPRTREFVVHFRTQLDACPGDPAPTVEEARTAFGFNVRIFDAVGARVGLGDARRAARQPDAQDPSP